MKGLSLILMVLVLGAGLAWLFLGATERGPRNSGDSPAQVAPPDPTSTGARPDEEPERGSTRSNRQSVPTGDAPEARMIYEGIVIGDGGPLPGADLEVSAGESVLVQASSDERGRFRLECRPLQSSGTLRLVARGFTTLERTLEARPLGGSVMLGNLRLVRGRRLTGRVLDGGNRGIADAEVTAQPVSSGTDVLVARARSGPDGTFELADAPPGALKISARAAGYGEQLVRHTPGTTPLEIRMEPGLAISFLLLEPRGKPVEGAEVVLQSQGDPQQVRRVERSDAQGRVRFEGLGSKVWTVRMTHPDYRPAGRSQVQPQGQEERIECVLWPAVEGVVRAPGGKPPPAGTRVRALPAAAPSDRVGVIEGGKEVAADGHFRLTGLRAGDWRIHVSAPGYAPSASLPVKLGIEGDAFAGTIELVAGGALAFRVELDGKPLPQAEIELFSSPPSAAQLWALATSGIGGGFGKRVTTDASGLASLRSLPAGPAWVAVFAEGCPPVTSGPHLVDLRAEPDPIAVRLEHGVRLRGQVLGKDGAPVERAQLRIVDADGRLGFPLTLASDDGGSYTTGWLPAGRYQVEAYAADEPTLRSETIELTLEAGEQRKLDLDL